MASVIGGTPTLLHLSVDKRAARSQCPDGPIPVRAVYVDDSGESAGEIVIWVKDGYLDGLEQPWYTDDPPDALPDPSRIVVSLE